LGVGDDATYGKEEIATDAQQDREIRAARNQALFRAVNETIRAVTDGFAVITGTFTVACECGDPGCLEMVEISMDEYERVRASTYTFVVRSDHVDPGVEHVVGESNGYVVVEMRGEAARTVLDETAPARLLEHQES
jgi:hypothetical protein